MKRFDIHHFVYLLVMQNYVISPVQCQERLRLRHPNCDHVRLGNLVSKLEDVKYEIRFNNP